MRSEPARALPLWLAILVAIAAGPVLDAGFPDRDWWPLTFVGVGLVLVTLIGRRPRSALLVGFLAGASFYFVHIEWASLFLGPLPMSALSVLEALFFALGAVLIALAYRWIPRAWPSTLGRLGLLPAVVAGLWTAREAVASVWPYGGFAWGRVALSQSQSPFSHLFAWLGVSGVSFVMVWLVALAIEAIRYPGIARLPRAVFAAAAIAAVLLVPSWHITPEGTMRVAAVQGNGKAGYFDQREPGDLLRAQLEATRPLFGQNVDVVLWPEGSSEYDPLTSKTGAEVFDYVSSSMDAPLVAGVVTNRDGKIFNSSLLWKAGEGAVDIYDKRHPVPFGEYVPDRAFWMPFAPDLIGLIGRDYTPGTTDMVFDIDGVIAGVNICFDIVDDAILRESVAQGAQVIFAQSNNADFGRTDEGLQQLAIARIRALELGRSVVNISTVGRSAIIAPDGSTLQELEWYTPGSMTEDVPLSTATTPAALLGGQTEGLLAFFGLGALGVALVTARSTRRRAD